MNHIRTTLAALLVFGAATVAVAQTTPPTTQRRGDRAHIGPRGGFGGPGGMAMHARGMALRGLTLSDAEKANLKAVHEKYAPQMKALREQLKPQFDAMRTARQSGDTAAFRALREKTFTAQREATQRLAEAQRADIRAALSAENQVKFDANVAKMQERLKVRGDSLRKHRRPPGA